MVTRLHGMEQSGVRFPSGPPHVPVALRPMSESDPGRTSGYPPDSPDVSVAQWIEQIRPKDKMGVRFPPRGQ